MALALVTGGNRGIGLEVADPAAAVAVGPAIEAAGRRLDVLVNAVCPGWVRTNICGAGAARSVEEGAGSVLWAARLGPDGPTGGFFRDGQPVP